MGRAIERLKKKKITTEYKPYKCTVCNKTFVSKQGLNGHIERVKKKKITTEYKPYKCSVCDKNTLLCDKEAHRCTSVANFSGTWRTDLGKGVCESTDSNDEDHVKNDYPTYEDECEFYEEEVFQCTNDLESDVFDDMSQMKL